jgi:TfoX/Sxy family transcriptional regulator of competence genes
MAFNPEIETRVQKIVSRWKNTSHKKMFGGVCHLVNGNMFCGVLQDYLILRLGEKAAGNALAQPHVRPFDITGRPMKGWVMVESDSFKTEDELEAWLDRARDFVKSMSPKSAARKG